MTGLPKGWDAPQRNYIKSLPVTVFVIDLRNNDDIIHKHEIDLSNKDDRVWLGKVTAWAVQNHYSIETMGKTDAEEGQQG